MECMPPSGSQTLIGVKVSPWYPPRHVISLCRPGRPRLRWYCSAIFAATSTDTEPESEKNTVSRPAGVISTSSCASRAAGSCVRPPNITWFIRLSCRVIAASSTGCPCPCTAVHHELIASMTWTGRPSWMRVSMMPCASVATTAGKASAPMVLYGCQMWAVSIAEISAGFSAGTRTEPNRPAGTSKPAYSAGGRLAVT